MASIEARCRQPDGSWRTLRGDELKDPVLTREATWRAMLLQTLDRLANDWVVPAQSALRADAGPMSSATRRGSIRLGATPGLARVLRGPVRNPDGAPVAAEHGWIPALGAARSTLLARRPSSNGTWA
ncbi:MAG: hypothetical protein H6746_11550 [Deltaproteobacteria bacterium]|nr:hypothetical protein [Deltaproteobacteria bacterium]